MKATAKDLRFHSKELIDSVSRGEEVVITFRGKPCAKLVPFKEPTGKTAVRQRSKAEENKLFGMWKDNATIDNINEHVRNLRKGRF
jgi:prevent-host-death family protein